MLLPVSLPDRLLYSETRIEGRLVFGDLTLHSLLSVLLRLPSHLKVEQKLRSCFALVHGVAYINHFKEVHYSFKEVHYTR